MVRLVQPLGRLSPHELGRLPGRALHRGGRQLVGDGRGDPVDQLVALVDDDDLVLGQQGRVTERVDGQQRVVGHHDIDRPGVGPRRLDEALLRQRALRTQALVGRDGDLPPRSLADAGDQLVAVAGRRLVGPAPQPEHLGPEPAGRGPLGRRVEERLLLGREAADQLVLAEVVAPALDQRVRRAATQHGGDGVGQPRQVAVDHLGLERQGRGGDDHRLLRRGRVGDGRDQVGQRLARAGAGLDQQVLTALDRGLDGRRHLHLTGPGDTADGRDGSGQQLLDLCVDPAVELGVARGAVGHRLRLTSAR